MKNRVLKFLFFVWGIFASACGQQIAGFEDPPDFNSEAEADAEAESEAPGEEFPKFIFEEAGEVVGSELIDLQQLPDGRWLVASRAGELFLLTEELLVIDEARIDGVDVANDFGLQNIELSPDFSNTGEVYVYFTPGFPDPSPPCDVRRCARLEKLELELGAEIEIRRREKVLDVPGVTTQIGHYGGGMAFLGKDLFLATGDGGTSLIAPGDPQDDGSLLGKLLRLDPSGSVEVYAKGLRNPFTMTGGNGGLFIANVGAKTFEEINFTKQAGLNFGWPWNEGPTDAPGITGPIHGYAFQDTSFIDQDPEGEPVDAKTVIAGVFYQGPAYRGALNHSLLYGEFFAGWVRALQFDLSGEIVHDRHVAHFTGITAMKVGKDGAVYAVSLFGSPHILRLRDL